MRKIVIVLFFVTSLFKGAYAQDSYIRKTADKFYELQNYGEAINFYEKLFAKQNIDSSSLKKLAISYLKIKKSLIFSQLL